MTEDKKMIIPMPIPIPIFMRKETKEEIELRGRLNFEKEERNRIRKLNEEIRYFKSKFNGDFRYNPYANQLKVLFPYKNIEDLSILELCQLGFNSDMLTRFDFTQGATPSLNPDIKQNGD